MNHNYVNFEFEIQFLHIYHELIGDNIYTVNVYKIYSEEKRRFLILSLFNIDKTNKQQSFSNLLLSGWKALIYIPVFLFVPLFLIALRHRMVRERLFITTKYKTSLHSITDYSSLLPRSNTYPSMQPAKGVIYPRERERERGIGCITHSCTLCHRCIYFPATLLSYYCVSSSLFSYMLFH